MSIWPQAAAEHVGANAMRGEAGGYDIPCFAGDLNDHLIVHSHMAVAGDGAPGTHELHVAQHVCSPKGKKTAVAYMKALLARNLAHVLAHDFEDIAGK
jgi:hypothetical protein